MWINEHWGALSLSPRRVPETASVGFSVTSQSWVFTLQTRGCPALWHLWTTLEEEALSWNTLNTQTLTKTKVPSCFREIYGFALGCIHSHPGLRVHSELGTKATVDGSTCGAQLAGKAGTRLHRRLVRVPATVSVVHPRNTSGRLVGAPTPQRSQSGRRRAMTWKQSLRARNGRGCDLAQPASREPAGTAQTLGAGGGAVFWRTLRESLEEEKS